LKQDKQAHSSGTRNLPFGYSELGIQDVGGGLHKI
jgi:hypothetical protein